MGVMTTMTMTMMRSSFFTMILAITLAALAAASFTSCGGSLATTHLYANPPGIVAADQNVDFRIDFTVPDNRVIQNGTIQFDTSWFGLSTEPVTHSLCDYVPCPLNPGSYGVLQSTIFPASVTGHVKSNMRVFSPEAEELLCASWVVYATGKATNETNWIIRKMYS